MYVDPIFIVLDYIWWFLTEIVYKDSSIFILAVVLKTLRSLLEVNMLTHRGQLDP
jgi:hypothetical protein